MREHRLWCGGEIGWSEEKVRRERLPAPPPSRRRRSSCPDTVGNKKPVYFANVVAARLLTFVTPFFFTINKLIRCLYTQRSDHLAYS
jgi:hypothetical protein